MPDERNARDAQWIDADFDKPHPAPQPDLDEGIAFLPDLAGAYVVLWLCAAIVVAGAVVAALTGQIAVAAAFGLAVGITFLVAVAEAP